MPTDPKTGERLPGKAGMYAGEPGAPADAPPMPEGEASMDETGKKATDALKVIDDELERRDKESGMDSPGDAGGELKDLVETLGVTPERAQMLFDAAQELDKTRGKSPKELAEMIASDFDVLMQLEMIAARKQDQPKPQPMAEQPQGMMPEGAPPMMTPMGPEGGM